MLPAWLLFFPPPTLSTSPPPPPTPTPHTHSQHVALGALEAGRGWVEARVASLAGSRAALLDALAPLRELGLSQAPSEGAIYLWTQLPQGGWVGVGWVGGGRVGGWVGGWVGRGSVCVCESSSR